MPNRSELFSQLLTDLQDGQMPLQQILLRVKVLAYDLKSEDLKLWVKLESGGYKPENDVPSYRVLALREVRAHFYGDFGGQFTNVGVAWANLPERLRTLMDHFEIRQGVASIDHTASGAIASKTDELHWQVPAGIAQTIQYLKGYQCLSAQVIIGVAQFQQILSSIRSRLLEFLLELRDQYPDLIDDSKTALQSDQQQVKNVFQTVVMGSPGAQLAIGTGSVTDSRTETSINNGASITELGELLRNIQQDVSAAPIDDNLRNDILSDIATALSQVESPKPRQNILQAAIQNILIGIAANEATPIINSYAPVLSGLFHRMFS